MAIYAENTAIFASSWSYKKATKYIQDYFRFTSITGSLLNPTKIQAITFIKKKLIRTDHIKVTEHYTPWTPTVKYLGIILDSKITWPLAIAKKTNLAYPTLKKLYPLLSRNSILKIAIKPNLNLYKICIRPIITYGYQIWTAAAKTHINKIQKIQNKFFRIILNKTHTANISSRNILGTQWKQLTILNIITR